MPSIVQGATTYTFQTLQGEFRIPQLVNGVVRRPHIDGDGVLYGNWHSDIDPFVSTAYVASRAAADTLRSNYQLLYKACRAGTLCTVYDGVELGWTNVAIMGCDPRIANVLSPIAPWRVSCNWLFLPNTVAP